MRRWLRRLALLLLVLGAVGGTAVAWRTEVAVEGAAPASRSIPALRTPVVSVRRLPSVLAGPVADRRLRDDVAEVAALLPPDSCVVVDGADVRVEHRADELVVPASIQKLLTATAALELLDPAQRFRTTAVAATAPVAGIVAGDLVLVGGGDPLLATADYAARFRRQPQAFTDLAGLASAIVAAGVRRIDGAVVGDEGRYDVERYVPGWPARYVAQHTIGPLSALSVNDGFAAYPTPDSPGGVLRAAADPAQDAAAVLTRLLEQAGVAVAAPARSGAAPAGAVEVAAIESASLADVTAQMLLESDNSTAELLLKELGRTLTDDPTTAGGIAAVAGALGSDQVQVADGSGLSLDDRLTCRVLVDLLGRPGTGEALQAALPIAGRTGTLDRRFADTSLEGVLRAKTGSLNTVAALAGVVDDGDPVLRFAVVVNVAAPARVPASVPGLQQVLGEVLVAWPRVGDLDRLGPLTGEG